MLGGISGAQSDCACECTVSAESLCLRVHHERRDSKVVEPSPLNHFDSWFTCLVAGCEDCRKIVKRTSFLVGISISGVLVLASFRK